MAYRRTFKPRGWKDETHGHLRKTVEREKCCKNCGGVFRVVSRGRILGHTYCSQKCQREALQKRATHPKVRDCRQCGASFAPKFCRQPARYCSPKCYQAAVRARRDITVACAQCGKERIRRRVDVARAAHVFCSVACRVTFHKGSNHAQFRGAATPFSGAWKRLSAEIRLRDHHTCRRCGQVWQKGERLYPVDHVYPRRAFSADPSAADEAINLVTLCHGCHGKKTTEAEAAWLRGDVLAFEAYKRSVLTTEQGIELRRHILAKMNA